MSNNISIAGNRAAATAVALMHGVHTNPAVHLSVATSDAATKAVVPHDGLETPFALLPGADGWRRFDLPYQHTDARTGRDWFVLDLPLEPAGLDRDEISRHGVAFGMDVSGPGNQTTTLWLQNPGRNFPV